MLAGGLLFPAMIDVEGLTRRFGPRTAVEDLSFHLDRGEVVGFLGPNGAGKTTTMRVLTGYLPATKGRVQVAGFDVVRESMEVRKRIGYLPENVPLYREHRVEEMLQFQARLHGLPRGDRKQAIGAALERVGLTDRARSQVGSLSRGLRQRAGLAVALLPRPEVLILDEPTSGLDPIQRLEVRALIRELAAEHTVLLSSHILAEVEAVCPRVIVLNHGRMAAQGTKEELVAQLGEGARVRFEVMLPNPAEALELIESLDGVTKVDHKGRLGIHQVFDVHGSGDEDLREDLGALAMSRSWAVRELSWRKPSLEKLFAQIALGQELQDDEEDAGIVPAEGDGAEASVSIELGGDLASGVEAAPKKAVYNLNPFAEGAQRDLSQPTGDEPDSKPKGGAPNLNPFENFGGGSGG